MGKFTTTPKIELFVALTSHMLHAIEAHLGHRITVVSMNRYLLDIDDAEKAVAWLKEHGVEQER